MKKIGTILVLIALMLCISACSGDVTETDNIKVDGVYVDTSYENPEDDSLRLVYMCYTFKATDEALSVDSKGELTIKGGDTYESEIIQGSCKYMPNYYYSDYIENVKKGKSMKVVQTFEVDEEDLKNAKGITIYDSSVPGSGKIKIPAEMIKSYKGIKEIGKIADPKGYKVEVEKRKPASSSTTSKVKNNLNGYYFTFYVNYVTYKLEFFSPNRFEITAALGGTLSNSGTYKVTNGYIMCTYPSNKKTIEIPWYFENGDLVLEAADAFDVNM